MDFFLNILLFCIGLSVGGWLFEIVIKKTTGFKEYSFYAKVEDGKVFIKAPNKNAEKIINSDDLAYALIESEGE